MITVADIYLFLFKVLRHQVMALAKDAIRVFREGMTSIKEMEQLQIER